MDLKKPYTLDEQIKKLKDHGVVISDDEFARNVLQKVSYYRLSGYRGQTTKSFRKVYLLTKRRATAPVKTQATKQAVTRIPSLGTKTIY